MLCVKAELKDSNPPRGKGKITPGRAAHTQCFSFSQELIWEQELKRERVCSGRCFFPGLLISKGFVFNHGLPLVVVFWERVNDSVFVLGVKM